MPHCGTAGLDWSESMAYTTGHVTGAVNVVLREGETTMKKKYERRNQDIGNIVSIEHVNVRVPDQSIATAGAAATPACSRFHVTRQRVEQNRACSRLGVKGVPHCAHSRTSAIT